MDTHSKCFNHLIHYCCSWIFQIFSFIIKITMDCSFIGKTSRCLIFVINILLFVSNIIEWTYNTSLQGAATTMRSRHFFLATSDISPRLYITIWPELLTQANLSFPHRLTVGNSWSSVSRCPGHMCHPCYFDSTFNYVSQTYQKFGFQYKRRVIWP